jgi:hypothetical protein
MQHRLLVALDLLHYNVRKYGTISNTVAAATKLEGKIVWAAKPCLNTTYVLVAHPTLQVEPRMETECLLAE